MVLLKSMSWVALVGVVGGSVGPLAPGASAEPSISSQGTDLTAQATGPGPGTTSRSPRDPVAVGGVAWAGDGRSNAAPGSLDPGAWESAPDPASDPGAYGRELLAAGDVRGAVVAWVQVLRAGPRVAPGSPGGPDSTLGVAVEVASTTLAHYGREVDRAMLAWVEGEVRAYILRVQAALPPTDANKRALAPVEAAHRALLQALVPPPAPRLSRAQLKAWTYAIMDDDPEIAADVRRGKLLTGLGIPMMVLGGATTWVSATFVDVADASDLTLGVLIATGVSLFGAGVATLIVGRVASHRALRRARDKLQRQRGYAVPSAAPLRP